MQDKKIDKARPGQPSDDSVSKDTHEAKSLLDAVVRANKKKPLESVQTGQSKPGAIKAADARAVPAFDLAEEIMAQQRKITATKRISPATKTNGNPQSEHAEPKRAIKRDFAQQNRLIAEIVARDIRRLCEK